jgi:transcription elongation factor Elf1
MGIASYAAKSAIESLVCPRCDASHADDWECLESDQLSEVRCSDCGQYFSFYLDQCIHCAEESIFIWACRPTPYWRALLTCQFCGGLTYEFIDESIAAPRPR